MDSNIHSICNTLKESYNNTYFITNDSTYRNSNKNSIVCAD